MFVSELVVLSSVNYIFNTLGRSAILLIPQRSGWTRVVGSVLMSIYAQEEHCT